MSKFVDYTGKKFNHLTVIKELGKSRVLCQCDCGKVIEAKKYNVISGSKKSCGCVRRETNSGSFKIKDRTGEKFNHLTIIKELGGDRVLCQCDCGNTIELMKSRVVGGFIKSCGCMKIVHEDLTGKKFNKLTVIKKAQDKPVKWLCQCDCGNTITVDTARLKSGAVKSCGCLKTVKFAKAEIDKFEFHGTNIKQISPERKINKNNKSGTTGVYFHKGTGKYTAVLTLQKKAINLGYFNSKEEAITARKEAEEKYFKPVIENFEEITGKKKIRITLPNLVGKKFNMLTILQDLENGSLLCRCDCGNVKRITRSKVITGHVKSCGCLKKVRKKENLK